eukprot:TRINITY_DN20265_c0_g1_i1.p1 TRINITY_DN20265_c0_g1~~TRINITY_DN20265_c0_g1_i1.p1  ORF type:complete len:164 (+),score=36.00 TRINITY_DN20265_c0_g1_i1:110-601(+)
MATMAAASSLTLTMANLKISSSSQSCFMSGSGGSLWQSPVFGAKTSSTNHRFTGAVCKQTVGPKQGPVAPLPVEWVKKPVLTEKSIKILQRNQYTFDVDQRASKPQMKAWVEAFFNVKVVAMNSHRPPRKTRRMGMLVGHPVRHKRMIVTLKEDDTIPLFNMQ